MFFNFRQAEDESCEKFLKHFLDLNSYLNISGIGAMNHSHLTDMEYTKLVKSDPKKSTILSNKEADSSSSEALTSMFFPSSSDYNRFVSLIVDISQVWVEV